MCKQYIIISHLNLHGQLYRLPLTGYLLSHQLILQNWHVDFVLLTVFPGRFLDSSLCPDCWIGHSFVEYFQSILFMGGEPGDSVHFALVIVVIGCIVLVAF